MSLGKPGDATWRNIHTGMAQQTASAHIVSTLADRQPHLTEEMSRAAMATVVTAANNVNAAEHP